MKLTNFPQEIIDEYKLNGIVNNNRWVYMKIRKASYGHLQSSALTTKKLAADLKPYGYYKVTQKTVSGNTNHVHLQPSLLQFLIKSNSFE